MTCYNGSPDVDYSKAAAAFGVEGETVKEQRGSEAARSRAPRTRRWKAGLICSTSTSSAKGLARCREWHPPYSVAEPADAEGVIMRCVLLGFFALAIIVAASPSRAQQCQSLAGGRRPRHRRGGVFAMPLPRHHRQNSRRRGRLAHLCQQHGAARRAIDGARGRQGRGLSRAQSGPGRASCRRRSRSRCRTGRAKTWSRRDCMLCHDLERVATIKRSKQDWPAIVANMVARGATATPDEDASDFRLSRGQLRELSGSARAIGARHLRFLRAVAKFRTLALRCDGVALRWPFAGIDRA